MQNLKKLILTGIAVFSMMLNIQAKENSKLLPRDHSVRYGVLPNGITYYIKHNQKPKNRASFYIYQNVGSTLENDNQNGLAHFLEHMAFNGTKNFPGKLLLNTLQKHGIEFGRDINAYTSPSETVYNISRVPTKNKNLLDTCLLALYDWCDGVSLLDEEIDNERGVIIEEKREGEGFKTRLREKLFLHLFNNSMYSKRNVIGTYKILKTFKYKTIKDFYHNWYRTDLQAIGIVGDFDVKEMEKKVIKLFSKIKAIENPTPRPFIEIKDKKEVDYVLITDKEITSSSLGLSIRHKAKPYNTENSIKNNYLQEFFNSMVKYRFQKIQQKESTPYISGEFGYSSKFTRGYETFGISISSKEGKEKESLEKVYEELERVKRYGFIKSELDRVKTSFLATNENNFKSADQKDNDAYAKNFSSDYLENKIAISPKYMYELSKKIINSITLKEVNSLIDKWMTDKNRVFYVFGPDKKGIHISKKEILNSIKKIEKVKIEPYTEESIKGKKLINKELKGGKIVKEKRLKEFSAVEWTLSNGAIVVFRKADYEKENVSLTGTSYGGTSLYENNEVINAQAAISSKFGLGDYDQITLNNILIGNTANVNVKIEELTEVISGKSTPKDFETLLKLTYMQFEAPRFDEKQFNLSLEKKREGLINRDKSTFLFMLDTLSSIMEYGNPRVKKIDAEYLNSMNFKRMTEIYKERFSDASDFKFIIVGNLEEKDVKPLIAKYIGSIKDIDRKETWVDRKMETPKGELIKDIKLPVASTPKANNVIIFDKEYKYSRKKVLYAKIIKGILTLRYTENIREKEGGTYGVHVNFSESRLPREKAKLTISFNSAVETSKHLKSLVFKEIDIIQKEIKEEDLKKTILNMKKNHEQVKLHNKYWADALDTYYFKNENVLKKDYFEDIIDNVTKEDIIKEAKSLFKDMYIINLRFLP